MVVFVALLCFFVNSRAYLGNGFIRHIIDINRLHHLNWVALILFETLDSISACQQKVRDHEDDGGRCNIYHIGSPLGLMVWPNYDFHPFISCLYDLSSMIMQMFICL